MKASPSLLVCRTDHLGDVLLTLPALKLARQSLPHSRIGFMCQENAYQAIRPFLGSETIEYISKENLVPGWDISINLFDDVSMGRLLKSAKIPYRVANYTKLLSRWYYNDGYPQHRSQAQSHESEYNSQMIEFALRKVEITPLSTIPPIEIPVDTEEKILAIDALSEIGVKADIPITIVHPGMRGSALNLSADSYFKIFQELMKKENSQLLLSVGPESKDLELEETLKQNFPALKILKALPIGVFREVLRLAALVIAPSTGPLHLAHFVGTTTYGIYSPVLSHHAKRWRPQGGTGRAQTHAPNVQCPATRHCLLEKCREFNCMEKTNWTAILADRFSERA